MKLFVKDNGVNKMITNPEFLFRVGRLIGATEMVGHILSAHKDQDVAALGDIILDRLTWFPADEIKALPTMYSEAPTEIREPEPLSTDGD